MPGAGMGPVIPGLTGGTETGGIGTMNAGLAAALTVTSPRLICTFWSNWNGNATNPFADEDSWSRSGESGLVVGLRSHPAMGCGSMETSLFISVALIVM